MKQILRVLAVISNQTLLAKFESLMQRRTLEVNHVSSGAAALVLAGNLRYELLVIESPLPDLDIEKLLAEMRALDSISIKSTFLILTSDGAVAAGVSPLQDETIKLVDAAAEPSVIHDALSELLGVAARRCARLLVQVEVQLEDGPVLRLYQSQNLSESGIPLRGGRKLQIGSKVGFDLGLPGGEAIRGRAMVVRHTTPKEPVVGTALRFLDLGKEPLARLRSFVYAGLTSDEQEPLRVVGGER